jgi:hypothetical protein
MGKRRIGWSLGGYVKERKREDSDKERILGNSWGVTDGHSLYFYCKHIHNCIHDHNIYLDIVLLLAFDGILLTAP